MRNRVARWPGYRSGSLFVLSKEITASGLLFEIKKYAQMLAAGGRVGVFRGVVVLQKLIHRLKCLVVFVEDLQVFDCG